MKTQSNLEQDEIIAVEAHISPDTKSRFRKTYFVSDPIFILTDSATVAVAVIVILFLCYKAVLPSGRTTKM